ncbi:cystathione beta-lyase [Nitrosomonas sp. PY1]|uniref:MalY/PatB family protein n=1 Tax=Nitrosomonas sp. PY1 TaxID=1803906 RepID=UPI001FC7C166|nr:PatB family C-S lyase [Nitrosomonas sp. PY1]GKS69398.1 cystathione beta-lyase [Nitrosomonas sp. PY1]
MSGSFDFDQEINRDGTSSTKYDGRYSMFGRSDIIPAWVADMDFSAPPAVTQALIQRAAHPIYGYTMFPEGLYEALIVWIKRRYHWDIQRDWIVMCPGVVPSINAAIVALTQPGDGVIVQPPVYFPFFSAVTQANRNLIYNPLRIENQQYNRYIIDFDHLEQCAKDASFLLLCSPHNPVGRVWSPEELKRLLGIAEKYNLIVFSDEIHADLIYANNQHYPLAMLSNDAAKIITAVAPSKTFNIPGLNLSALIIPDKPTRNAVKSVFSNLHINPANPFSIVAFEAAYREGEEWLEALLAYLQDTRDAVQKILYDHLPEVRVTPIEGTYLMWLDFRAWSMTDAQLKHFFVHQVGIGMSPGILFGTEGSGFMRLNIAAPRRAVNELLKRLLCFNKSESRVKC